MPFGDSRRLAQKLEAFPVLAGLAPVVARLLARAGLPLCLPAGTELERVGATDRGLVFVVSGTMRVAVDDGRGGLETIAYVRAGETLGEMSLLTDDPHSARLFAHRDTELLALDRATFDRIATAHPGLMRNISLVLVHRLRRTTQRAATRHGARSVALVTRHPGVDLRRLAAQLSRALGSLGQSTAVVDERDIGRPADWFHAVEAGHDVVLALAGPDAAAWARAAERRSDRVLVVTTTDADDARALTVHGYSGLAADRIVLGERLPETTGQPTGLRHLLRPGSHADAARLARTIAGRATGLVLSGGGARGFAHLGVIRALREMGICIDAVGGASMGAVIAAGLALEWPCEELAARMRAAFVTTNPMSDITLPTVAFFGGRKVRSLLDQNFGARRIEELPLPFTCVTSDLTGGVDMAHTSGPLAERLRASVALPGLLPPVVIDGRVHVDGGVMNNLPVEHVARLGADTIIAVDVSGDTSLLPAAGASAPGILSTLVRTGTVGNEWQRREARRRASVVVDPPVQGIGFRDWQAFERAVASGYRHAYDSLAAVADTLPRAS